MLASSSSSSVPMPFPVMASSLFHLMFIVTLAAANDPPPPAQIGGVVTNRIDAIRTGLIHALSTPTSSTEKGTVSVKLTQQQQQQSPTNRSVKMPCQSCVVGTGKRQFEFNAYKLDLFNQLMDLWHIPKQQLLNSLKMGELNQISNPNGRNSNEDIFIKTADKQFFIKDVKTGNEGLTIEQRKALKTKPRAEIDFFQKDFRAYCKRMEEELKFFTQQSMLPKFFAFFGIKDNSYGVKGEERFFLVTKNLFPANYKNDKNVQQQFTIDFTYKFDVKGSLDHQKLSALKRGTETTFRYLDLYDEAEHQLSDGQRAKLEEKREGCFFRNGILLADDTYEKFIGILERDAVILKEIRKTDYSLLLGITFDKLSDDQMELLKKENPNILMASCKNCSSDRGQSYSSIDSFTIIPGIIDTLAQFNWRKIIDLTKRTIVKQETEKKAKSAIGPIDYFHRFMCAISTKVFRPQHNLGNQLEANENRFCNWEITEPKIEQ